MAIILKIYLLLGISTALLNANFVSACKWFKHRLRRIFQEENRKLGKNIILKINPFIYKRTIGYHHFVAAC